MGKRQTHSKTPQTRAKRSALSQQVIANQPVEKIKTRTAARRPHAGRTSIRDVIIMLKLRHHVASQHIQDFLEVCFHVFLI